jgi:alpha-tubulin suppressor-like RCC1 family protein
VIDAGGDVLCWGRNDDGELGIGNNDPVFGVQKVQGLPPGGARQVAVGGQHICTLMMSGDVWCWGYNHDGMLGDGTPAQALSLPIQVPEITGALELGCGAHHTCARMSDGSVLCFGRNDLGQLGDGTVDSRPQAARVEGISGAVRLGVRADTTCALVAGGMVTCAGVVLGTELSAVIPAPSLSAMPIEGLTDIVRVRMGARHACALDSSARLYCWGSDGYGQLGLGSMVWYPDPVQLSGL